MKKRTLAALGILVSTALTFTACGSASTTTTASSAVTESTTDATNTTDTTEDSASDTEESDTIYGEVASYADGVLTINVGTKDSDTSNDLTLTGETKEITVSDSTTITKGGMGGQPGGDAPAQPSDSTGSAPSSDGSTPPEKPDSNTDSSDTAGSGAPEKPDGSSDAQGSSDSSAPEKPSDSGNGSADGSAPADAPDGGSAPDMSATTDDLTEETKVAITLADDGSAETITILSDDMGGGMGAPGGSTSSDVSYSSDNEISEDTTLSDTSVSSTGTDEEAILVDNGATADLSNLTIDRTSSDSTGGDNSSFYGVGATVLTTDGTTYLSGSTITSDAKGAVGVFSYSDKATTYVADTTITTSQDTSGGIHVAGGGTLYAYDVTATTSGESSAAIRSDRGSGTMVVDGGTYTSNGTGSPAVYSTADITVNNATLTANSSEAACIEGDNTIRLFDCDLSGNMPDDNEQNDCLWNVILYQSMSGDSEVGNSTFEMVGGSLTANAGGMFYTTNTDSTFIIDNVDITPSASNDFFLKVTGNANGRGWGTSGANGANCTFTAIDQTCEGDIIWDSISNLDFYLTGSSTLTGAVIDDETAAGDGGDGTCSLYLGSDATWVVTGNSTLTNLCSEGTITDADGNAVSIVGTDGTTYVEGTSSYTITVGSYSTTADLSGAGMAESFSDYAVEEPSELNA